MPLESRLHPRRSLSSLVGLGLVLVLGAMSCAGPAQQSGPPGWFPGGDREAYPPGEWLVGLGACGPDMPVTDRASCAVHRARRELAFSIRSEVEASVRMSSEAQSERLWSGANGRSSSRVSETESLADAGAVSTALEMHNVEPRETHCDAEHCYAMVAVRRREIASRVAREVATDELRLEGMLAEAQRADLLRAVQVLTEADALARSIDRAGALHQSLTGINPVDPPASGRVRQRMAGVLSEASVCFVSGLEEVPASQVFARSVERMRAVGVGAVRTASIPSDCGPVMMMFRFEGSGDLRWSRTTLTDDQPVTMEFTGSVHFWVAEQGDQVSRRISARGMHVAAPQAIDAAAASLSSAIQGFVEEVLAGAGQP